MIKFNTIIKSLALIGVGVYIGSRATTGRRRKPVRNLIKNSVKDVIAKTIVNGVETLLYGEAGSDTGYRSGYSTPRRTATTNYAYKAAPRRERAKIVEEHVFETRTAAAEAVEFIREAADLYGSVSIADYYDMIGSKSEYTDHNYGWLESDISKISIYPIPGGYQIHFPQPTELL